MKISALIPTYNRRKYVQRAIESVLSQTVSVDEVIVVDDGSTDGTAEEIERRFGDSIRIIRQTNQGVSGARLRAIQEAHGEWIAFLDSDDEWLPDRNRQLAMAAEQLPSEVAWLFGDMRIVNDEGEGVSLFEKYRLTVTGHPQIFENSLRVVYPFQFAMLQSSLIRRDVLLETGCFVANLRTHEDLLVGFQVACNFKFAGIASVVTKFYRTSDLLKTSLEYNGLNTPDHYRALMLAFPLVMKKMGKRDPWAQYYAKAVRGLCKLRAAQGGVRRLALEQFRYEISLVSILFFCAAMLGRKGIQAWNAARPVLARSAPGFTTQAQRGTNSS